MNEEQTATTQPEILSPIEDGAWFLSILAGVMVGSLAVYASFIQPYRPFMEIGIILGGAIGGILAGFMPYLTQHWQISKKRWELWILINSILIAASLLICVYYFYLAAQAKVLYQAEHDMHSVTLQSELKMGLDFLFSNLVVGIITGLPVAAITRWVCQRWQNSQASWKVWTVAGIIIVVITSVPIYFERYSNYGILFQGIFGFIALLQITFSGIFLAWSASKISNIWVRALAQFIGVVLQVLVSFFLFPIESMVFAVLWIPVVAQLVYVNKNPAPKLWKAALIGWLVVLAEKVLVFMLPRY
jgi:hypothetical protein